MIANAARIRSELEKLGDIPTPVRSWIVEEGLDATDDEAVWVWALLEDRDVDAETRFQLKSMARKVVRDQTSGRFWPYVRIRGAFEEDETA